MRFQEPKANNNSRQNKIKFMTTGVRLMSHTLTLLFSSRAIYIYISTRFYTKLRLSKKIPNFDHLQLEKYY